MTAARVKWIEDHTFLGTDANGYSTVISTGSDGPGVGPMQMLLLGLGGCAMVDLVMIRTHEHASVERFAQAASVPVINGLTDDFHPCQIDAEIAR